MLGEHFAGCKAHDAAPDRGEHAELEAGEGDGRGPQARGHEQGGGDGHLAGVLNALSFYVLFSFFQSDQFIKAKKVPFPMNSHKFSLMIERANQRRIQKA